MKILIAEDDLVSRRLLVAALVRWGYEVVAAEEGLQAWDRLQGPDPPRLVVLDWMMPGLSGVDLCRRIRSRSGQEYVYVLMLTAKGRREEVVEGFEAGADDYLTKPFDLGELRARVRAGARILDLESTLTGRLAELQEALAHVRQLQGLLPICMHCKRIRDAGDDWQQIEAYISAHSEAQFSHGLCDDCLRREYPEIAADVAGRP